MPDLREVVNECGHLDCTNPSTVELHAAERLAQYDRDAEWVGWCAEHGSIEIGAAQRANFPVVEVRPARVSLRCVDCTWAQ